MGSWKDSFYFRGMLWVVHSFLFNEISCERVKMVNLLNTVSS